MRKILLIIVTIIFTAGITLSGCSESEVEPTSKTTSEPTSAPTSTPEPTWEWPSNVIIGTSGIGSSNYAQTVAWSAVLEQQTDSKVRVVPFEGDSTRVAWVKQGSLDTTITSAGDLPNIIKGQSGTATRDGGPFQVRVL